ncbi:MAG: ABC transporter substrate-binding protein [Phycisphaerae bacterium]|nr:ABC transporter substrate-binding protein [Phycisphaerae bacterium]
MKTLLRFCFVLLAGSIVSEGCDGKPRREEEKPPEVLRVSTHGGAYRESQEKAFFQPYSKIMGVTVLVETQEANLYEKLQAAVSSGEIPWDVVVTEGAVIFRAIRDGLLEPIDYTVVNKDNLFPWAANPYGVANIVYSEVLAYSTVASPAAAARPTCWRDFFDVKRFPGPRCLRAGPVGNLEIALLADGVEPEKLYPLDVERALRKLDEIKPHVKVWWKEGAEPPKLLADGTVVLSLAYNGRIWAARQDGAPLQIEWNQGLLDNGWWVVPKGLPEERKQRAMHFIAFATRAEPQANQARIISYGPTNIYAVRKVPEDVQRDLPTEEENLKKQIRIDNEWWAQHEDAILKRWNEWKGEKAGQ